MLMDSRLVGLRVVHLGCRVVQLLNWHTRCTTKATPARTRRARDAPVDSGAEEHQVGAQQLFDDGQRDGGRLVDDQQLRLVAALVVLRLDVLDGLAVVAEDVHAHDRLAERRVGGLHQVVVDVLLSELGLALGLGLAGLQTKRRPKEMAEGGGASASECHLRCIHPAWVGSKRASRKRSIFGPCLCTADLTALRAVLLNNSLQPTVVRGGSPMCKRIELAPLALESSRTHMVVGLDDVNSDVVLRRRDSG